MSEIAGTRQDLERVLSPKQIRAQAEAMYARALSGETHFAVHPEKLADCAALVAQVTCENYPTLKIPYHSRWNHFAVGDIDRAGEFRRKVAHLSADEQLAAELDLVVVSVLLDAGAGDAWGYEEAESGRRFSRSEGLAVASFRMFLSGAFSSDPENPFQADAAGLAALHNDAFCRGMQVSENNPLPGAESRLQLLHSLAAALQNKHDLFGDIQRPGGLLGYFQKQSPLQAVQVLRAIQDGLGSIWPGRSSIAGVNLGDVWHYAPFGSGVEGLVPFHKLSQWLSYSLIDSLERGGVKVAEIDQLTGLAEYRNGGLFLDGGVLSLRDARDAEVAHLPSSAIIIEWRALTLALLDRLLPLVRTALGVEAASFPLACMLEGGSWWAGRRLASKRPGGGAPLRLESDGTVF